jgi:asparagine synthase (glutamine-hydrolysing)
MAACDGPMPSLAFYPIWKLYQHIKQAGISVTLDGQGADEMLGGYYLGYQAMKGAWQSRHPLWCWDLFRTYRSLDSASMTRIQKDLRAVLGEGRQEIGQHLKRPLKKILGAVGLYSARPSKLREPVRSPAAVSASDPDSGNELAHALWNQFFVGPLPYLLHQYDRCSMASGVECRMPFMDYRVVEYVFSLPLRSRIGGGYTKRVLREAVRGILPEETRAKRQKMGFNAPFSEWICGPLHEWTQDLMSSQAFGESSYFDGNSFRRQFRTSTDANLKQLTESILWPCLHATWWELNRSESS